MLGVLEANFGVQVVVASYIIVWFLCFLSVFDFHLIRMY